MKFWTEETNQALKQYQLTKDSNIYKQYLDKPINKLISASIYRFGVIQDDDLKEDEQLLREYVINYALFKIVNYQTSQQYLYLSIRNQYSTIKQSRKEKKRPTSITLVYEDYKDDNDYEVDEDRLSTNYIDEEERKELITEQRNRIIKELDRKIKAERKPQLIALLILLKNYLIENDYEGAGFIDYAAATLNISRKRTIQACSLIKIKTKCLK